jgi:hypothetical protein
MESGARLTSTGGEMQLFFDVLSDGNGIGRRDVWPAIEYADLVKKSPAFRPWIRTVDPVASAQK